MKSDKSLQPSVKTHPPYLYPPGLYRQNLPTLINLLITGLVFTLVIYYFKDSTSEHYSILFFSSNLQLVGEPAQRMDDVSYRPSPIPLAGSFLSSTCRRSGADQDGQHL